MNTENVLEEAITKVNDNINISANNLDVGCITNPNNKFSLDSDGNLIVNSITTNTNNSILDFDSIYPVGSVYTSSSNTNPSSLFGGTWELIDKEFIPRQINLTDSIVTGINANKVDDYFGFITVAGHSLRFRVQFAPTVDLTDYSIDICSFDFSKIGITGFSFQVIAGVGGSDGSDGLIMYNFNTSTKKLSVIDVVPKGNATTLVKENNYFCNFEMTVRDTDMLDSFCNKFYWKRVS